MADFSTPLPQAEAAEAAVANSWKARLTTATRAIASLSVSFFDPRQFSRPASQAEWLVRVPANARHFAPVYACFFAPVMLHTMLSSTWYMLGSLLLCGLWCYAYGIKRGDEQVLGVPLPKLVSCSIASVLVMLLTGMVNALFYALLVFSLVGMPHASFHVGPTADALDTAEVQSLQP